MWVSKFRIPRHARGYDVSLHLNLVFQATNEVSGIRRDRNQFRHGFSVFRYDDAPRLDEVRL